MKTLRWIAALIAALALPAQAELRDIRYDYQRAERAQTDFTAADAGVQRVVLAQLMLAQFTSTNPSVTGVFNPASPGPIGATTPDAITGTTITATTKFVAPAGLVSAVGYSIGATNNGIYASGTNDLRFSTGGTQALLLTNGSLALLSDTQVISLGASSDTILARDAANTLAQRNGTNAQAFRVYNTFTDASNYERATLDWASANVFTIQTTQAGTGTARVMTLQGAGRGITLGGSGSNWHVAQTGNFNPTADNTYDIGITATNRIHDVFLNGSAGGNASAGAIGEYWEAQCGVATSGASQAFTSASPTVGTWASPPWLGTGVPFGSFACPFQITANAPTGLSTATNYWAVPIDATTFHVSTSAANAAAGTFANTSGSTATANLTSTLVFTSAAGLSVAQMNLTAGDWDCYGSVIYVPGATTSVTNLKNGIGSSSTVIGGLGSYSDFETAANVMTATNNPVHITPPVRQLLSATTASYLVGLPTFTASTLNGAGDLRCRRIR